MLMLVNFEEFVFINVDLQFLIVFNLVVYYAYHIYVMVANSLILISEISNSVLESSLRIPFQINPHN